MSTSTGAPARIWVGQNAPVAFVTPMRECHEYVRADEHDRIVAELVAALKAGTERLLVGLANATEHDDGWQVERTLALMQRALALARTEEPHG